ncbi:MAG TPA: helix-turn-helix transcriptional regulator [Spirochaetota bacterium]|nr:helix-turn-helix transcriptional regulator [Spirochaetota bacterium]
MKDIKHPRIEEITLTGILSALGDPVRLQIVSDLYNCHQKCCGQFGISLSKSTLTHHFRTLRDAGLINVRCDGTQRQITLRKEEINKKFPGLLNSIIKSADKE